MEISTLVSLSLRLSRALLEFEGVGLSGEEIAGACVVTMHCKRCEAARGRVTVAETSGRGCRVSREVERDASRNACAEACAFKLVADLPAC